MKTDVRRQLVIAGCCRKFSDMIIACYLPIFFMTKYPSFKVTYALCGAVSLSCFGFISNLACGIAGDKFEKKNPLIKS